MKSMLILSLFFLSCSLEGGDRPVFVHPPAVTPAEASVWGPFFWELRVHTADGIEEYHCAAGEGLSVDLDPVRPAVLQLRPLAGTVAVSGQYAAEEGHSPQALSLPAGALWPRDAHAPDEIRADWFGGIVTNFYLELARREFPGGRRAASFNWPRFRALLEAGHADGSFPEDLWSVDWALVARKTLDMGFDRRRIKRGESVWTAELPPGNAVWLSDSPFNREAAFPGGAILAVAGRSTARWYTGDAVFSASAEGCLQTSRPVE